LTGGVGKCRENREGRQGNDGKYMESGKRRKDGKRLRFGMGGWKEAGRNR